MEIFIMVPIVGCVRMNTFSVSGRKYPELKSNPDMKQME